MDAKVRPNAGARSRPGHRRNLPPGREDQGSKSAVGDVSCLRCSASVHPIIHRKGNSEAKWEIMAVVSAMTLGLATNYNSGRDNGYRPLGRSNLAVSHGSHKVYVHLVPERAD